MADLKVSRVESISIWGLLCITAPLGLPSGGVKFSILKGFSLWGHNRKGAPISEEVTEKFFRVPHNSPLGKQINR